MSTQNGVGPIIRIRPEVLHVNDPEFIDQLFGSAGKRRDKYKIAITGFAAHKASLGTIKHELHRSRRAALNPFFSKQSIRRLEPILHHTLAKVLRILSAAAKSGESMRMNLLYSATTSDIIYEYCFGQSANNLDRADLNEQFFTVFHESAKGFHFACYNPWFVPIIQKLPIKVMAVLMPGIEVFLELVVVSQYICFISLDKVLILAVLNQEARRGQRIPQDEHRRGYGTNNLTRIAQQSKTLGFWKIHRPIGRRSTNNSRSGNWYDSPYVGNVDVPSVSQPTNLEEAESRIGSSATRCQSDAGIGTNGSLALLDGCYSGVNSTASCSQCSPRESGPGWGIVLWG